MRCFTITALILLVAAAAEAVQVRVLDAETGNPVEAAVVRTFDGGLCAVTDGSGFAHFADLASSSSLLVERAGYLRVRIAYTELQAHGFVVRLDPRTYTTDEYVVTSTRFHTTRDDLPQAVTDISLKTISFHNPQTSADVLTATGQVFVQKSQLGGGSPMLRGFAANSVLLVVDGVRMNNAIFRTGNLQNVIQIDPSALERASVLYGPGSVQFGSDALGGVMHFETVEPTPSFNEKITAAGGAFIRTATANFEKTSHAHLSLGRGRVSSFTSLTYSDFDDLRTGSVRSDAYSDFGTRPEYVVRVGGEDVVVANDNDNVQTPSGYSQFNLLQKLSWQASPRVKLGYRLYWTTSSDIPRYDRLIEYRDGQLRSAQWYYGPQKWLMNAVSARLAGSRWFDRADLVVAQQRQEESRHDRRFGRNDLTSRTETVDVYSMNADLDKKFAPSQRLYYGLELIYNDVTSDASARDIETGEISPASTRYPDGGSQVSSAAAYVGHQWKLTPAAAVLTTGLRYSQTMLESKFEDTTFYNFPFDEIEIQAGALTASAGIALQPDSDLRLYAGLSSGFRAPNVDDVGKLFDSEPGNVVVPNPDLGPEYSYNTEVGAEKRFGDRLSLGGSAYYTWIKDVMVRRDFTFNGQDSILYDGTMSRVQAIVNAGHGYATGFDVHVRADMTSDLAFRTMLTYTAGRDMDEDVPLRHIPPLFGETRLTWERRQWIAEFFARYNFDKPFSDLAPEEQGKTYMYTPDGTPGWYTLNVHGGWRLHRALELQLALENILDHHYRPFSSGISAPGRNLIVALRSNF